MLGRIKKYDKVLPIVELYTAVQSEGSRDVILEKEDGVILGILVFMLKKVNIPSMI